MGELVRLCRSAAAFAEVGVDGLVLGFARNGQLLLNELREVLHSAPETPATFHRAFDSLDDPLRAIDALSQIPQIDRILTDGLPAHKGPAHTDRRPGLYDPESRCVRLREYSERAASRLTIIAGGGVDEEMLREIASTRCVREVHVGRAARGGGRESPVTAARVRRLRAISTLP
jgi:copper homeostasis protein